MRTKNILLLLTPSNPKRLEGIAVFAKSKSWHLTIADHMTHSLSGWAGDGALVTLREDKELESYVRTLRRRGVKVVDLTLTRPDAALPRVAGDNAAIGRLAAEYLKEKRYCNAAWFSSGWSRQHEARFAAFDAEMGGVCGKWVWTLESAGGGQDDWNALSRWLKKKLVRAPHPLAVLCYDDSDASRVESAALEAGLSVPGDVAMLGVGDDRIVCENQSVPLSSVRHDIRRVGWAGAALLDRLMNGGKAPAEPILIPPRGISERESTGALGLTGELVKRARDIYAADLARPPSTAQLAEMLGVSRASLDRTFSAKAGISPAKLLMLMRLDKAKRLMSEGALSLSEISYRLGFCNPGYFSNSFKKATGLSPKQWIARANEGSGVPG